MNGMTEVTSPQVRLGAEDIEFRVDHAYLARHACGVVIMGRGDGMHDRMVAHTAACTIEGNQE